MTKLKLFLVVCLAAISFQFANAQITLQSVKPGQELLVKPDNDTIWVMNNERMVKVIETGRLYRLEKEKSELLTQKCDTLQQIITEKTELADTLKARGDRWFQEQQKAHENTIEAGMMAKKYRRRARLASIGIGLGAIAGFAIGYLIFK